MIVCGYAFVVGCISILGLIKGLIIVGPILFISLVGFTGVAIILLPHDIFLTYKSLLKTHMIGINLKLMVCFYYQLLFFHGLY